MEKEVELGELKPRLLPCEITEGDEKVVLENKVKQSQLVLPKDYLDIINRFDGIKTIEEIATDIYHETGTVSFNSIIKSIHLLQGAGLLDAGDFNFEDRVDVFAEEMQDCEAKEDVCQVSDTFHLLEECVQRTTQRSSDKKFRCIVEVANQYEIRHTYCTPLASKEFYLEGARKEAMDDKECLIKHVKDDIDVLSVTKILLLKADWLRKMEPEHFKDIAAYLLQRMSETVVTMVYQYAAPQNSKLQEVSS